MQKSLEHYRWWQKEIIYQIYPRSFQDTNHDGTGDLSGIIRRLDYVQQLGVHAVWLSPIFTSPMHDFGYDIADYTDIDPLFGSIQDFDELLAQVHQRDMKLILDLVPNHTSHEHPWFQEARSSRDNPKRDWYIWKDPHPDSTERRPPNNWQSVFGGSGWEWDPATEQYYYHAFLKEQPDLNWRNPEVREAMLDVMKFWLDKGVDGFRIDVIWHLGKDELFRDNPPNPSYQEGQSESARYLNTYSEDQPIVYDIMAEMRYLVDSYQDRLLIGEIYLPIDRLVTYYGEDNSGVHLPFNFHLILTEWKAREIYSLINQYEGALSPDQWPNWVLGNHDQPRIISRTNKRQARLAAVLLLTLRGTPIMYYGDEIGMHDVSVPPDRQQDMRNTVSETNRDPQRTPMQWSGDPYAGFSSVEPWLPVGDDYPALNVTNAQADSHSMLSFYKSLIALRQQYPALQVGEFIPIGLEGELMMYQRVYQEKKMLILINFGLEKVTHTFSGEVTAEILLSTSGDKKGQAVEGSIELNEEEALVIDLAVG